MPRKLSESSTEINGKEKEKQLMHHQCSSKLKTHLLCVQISQKEVNQVYYCSQWKYLGFAHLNNMSNYSRIKTSRKNLACCGNLIASFCQWNPDWPPHSHPQNSSFFCCATCAHSISCRHWNLTCKFCGNSNLPSIYPKNRDIPKLKLFKET